MQRAMLNWGLANHDVAHMSPSLEDATRLDPNVLSAPRAQSIATPLRLECRCRGSISPPRSLALCRRDDRAARHPIELYTK
jgi:hypothetical protein